MGVNQSPNNHAILLMSKRGDLTLTRERSQESTISYRAQKAIKALCFLYCVYNNPHYSYHTHFSGPFALWLFITWSCVSTGWWIWGRIARYFLCLRWAVSFTTLWNVEDRPVVKSGIKTKLNYPHGAAVKSPESGQVPWERDAWLQRWCWLNTAYKKGSCSMRQREAWTALSLESNLSLMGIYWPLFFLNSVNLMIIPELLSLLKIQWRTMNTKK